MPTKHMLDPAILLICQYELEAGESTLKVMDADGVEQFMEETRIPIVDSEAKGEAFLHFIYNFSQAQ
jgi:hypothetical protein